MNSRVTVQNDSASSLFHLHRCVAHIAWIPAHQRLTSLRFAHSDMRIPKPAMRVTIAVPP
jgi:hypothetical protein